MSKNENIDHGPKLVEGLNALEIAESIARVRRGLESMRAGEGVDARAFLEEMRMKHNISKEDA